MSTTNNTQNTTQDKTILVTGGAGYIGSHTVLALLDFGYKVIIFDKHEPFSVFRTSLDMYGEQVVFWQGNLLNHSDLNELFGTHRIDGVIHFAADPAIVSPKPEHTSGYYTNNVISSINLIEKCRQEKVNQFVFSSTAAMYGIPESLPIMENSRLQPINVYGYTKSVIEKMLLDYHNSFGFESIRLRYFNACGADNSGRTGECHSPETHLIPCILQSVGSGKVFQMFGNDYNTPDGTNVRDYIHVSDLANAHVLALNKLFETPNLCEVVNLGTGSGYSNQQIFDTAQKVVGSKIPVELVERRVGDPDELVADNTKAKQFLGWTPTHSDLLNIIQTAWNWEQIKKSGQKI
jgi:UDP-glucose 4-epimerase